MINRRQFLQTSALAAAATSLAVESNPRSFAVPMFGDLHFDRREHHNLSWVEQNKPDDVSQIKNYTRITADLMPQLRETMQNTVDSLLGTNTPPAFVLQMGDLVEGLCGSAELAVRQNREFLSFFKDQPFALPFLFTKGNHDIAGPGGAEAFAEVFHPFLSKQRQMLEPRTAALDSARYSIGLKNAQFYFFDCYDPQSLAWLEAEFANHTAEHNFVVMHQPVIPYGARSNWIVFNSERQAAQRQRLMQILASHRAIVLGGHIHKFNYAVRQVGTERFAQLGISSVINSADTRPKDELLGLENYTPEQVRVEPQFQPESYEARRAVYNSERAFVRAFQYADVPGHAVLKVEGPRVTVDLYRAVSRDLYRTVELTALLEA